MSWAEDTSVSATLDSQSQRASAVVVEVVPAIVDPRTEAMTKIYIKNLHRDTSQADIAAILGAVYDGPLDNIYVSQLQRHGRRWAKVDVPASGADFLIEQFNMFCGVLLGQAGAEYARNG